MSCQKESLQQKHKQQHTSPILLYIERIIMMLLEPELALPNVHFLPHHQPGPPHQGSPTFQTSPLVGNRCSTPTPATLNCNIAPQRYLIPTLLDFPKLPEKTFSTTLAPPSNTLLFCLANLSIFSSWKPFLTLLN